LRVLTTSRAPLAISAERVYPLGELGEGDAARLFGERAVAARPGVRLTEQTVASIVSRLDGLPLAIELAAARVRAMSVEEIDRRLEDRFALLRGGDRSAPDRHQTLLAVIEWSWNLLDAGGQRALRRLALGRRLPRAVRAEDAEDLALAYMKVDSVDRTEPAEGLDQAGGVNGCCSCHGQNGKRLRLHRGYTAVSRTTDREGAVTRGG
jgi:predicted ATPase